MWTVGLLCIANIFMTTAWYWHLKYTARPVWIVIVVSWGIAFLEYCFQVPANRIGALQGWEPAQLKVVQEAVTMAVFCGFSVWYLKVPLKWNHIAAFVLIVAAVVLVFKDGLPDPARGQVVKQAASAPAPAEPSTGTVGTNDRPQPDGAREE
ncbi:MAG: DMT family protein [Planctomycetota bacterium]